MEEKRSVSSAEIDLITFFKPLGTLVNNIFDFANWVIRKLLANLPLFLGVVIVITAAGYSLRYIITPKYNISAYFSTRGLPPQFCAIQVGSLGKDYMQIPQLLQISAEAAGTIQSIGGSPLHDLRAKNQNDSAFLGAVFSIDLLLTSTEHIKAIQQGLVQYLENNPYMLARRNARLKTLQELRVILEEKLKSLDSLKKVVNSSIVPRSQGQGIILGEPINPVSVYQAEMTYMKEKLRTEEDLSLINNIEVVNPFPTQPFPNYPDFDRMAKLAFVGSVAIGFCLVVLLGKKSRPRNSLTANQS